MRWALTILVLSAAVGCTARPALWPDNSELIESAMQPPPEGEPLPGGIALGPDAPPLAPAEPEAPLAVGERPWASARGFGLSSGFLFPLVLPAPPPAEPPPRSLIRKTPFGTTPGLLP